MSKSGDEVKANGDGHDGGPLMTRLAGIDHFRVQRHPRNNTMLGFYRRNRDIICFADISMADRAKRIPSRMTQMLFPPSRRSREFDFYSDARSNPVIIDRGTGVGRTGRTAFRVTVRSAGDGVIGTAVGSHRGPVRIVDAANQTIAVGGWMNALVLKDLSGKKFLRAEIYSVAGPPLRGAWTSSARYSGAEVLIDNGVSPEMRSLALGASIGWYLAHRWHLGDRRNADGSEYFGWKSSWS